MSYNYEQYVFISDIHASLEDLKNLTKFAKTQPVKTQYVFLGDFLDGVEINDGDALKTLEFVYDFSRNHAVQIVLGNHDLLLLSALAGDQQDFDIWKNNGGLNTIQSLGLKKENLEEVQKFFSGDNAYLIKFLSVQPLIYETNNIIAVHAGIDWTKPLEKQDPDDLTWIREDYFFSNSDKKSPIIHKNSLNKIIVSGHTPTYLITNKYDSPIVVLQNSQQDVPRYVIDGGANSALPGSGINVLVLKENGDYVQGGKLRELVENV